MKENSILRSLINHIPHAIFWKDKSLVFKGCNLEFARQFGFDSPEDIIGKTDYDFSFPAHLIAQYHEDDQRIMETGIPKINFEEIQVQPDHSERVVSVSKVPFYNENNEIIGIIGIYTDITQKKNEEKQLKIAKEQAEAANLAKDEFLANMSHDIRTPLTGIIGVSTILEHEVNNASEKEHAHWVTVSGEQLLALLNSVLDAVSVSDKKESYVQMGSVDIRKLLQNIYELELPTIKLKHLNCVIKVADDVPEFLLSDFIKLHRIILNLLGNAIKFTEKGEIRILVKYDALTEKKGNLKISIQDTGKGIAKENQKKIFDKFFRIDPAYEGKYKGSGLGLHIVRQYLNRLHGSIHLKSELGKGTTFLLSIPVEMGKKNEEKKSCLIDTDFNSTTEIVSMNSIGNEKISNDSLLVLIIEDNIIALKVAESVVKAGNCEFLSATNGKNALKLSKSHKFNLILSDIGLPDFSGNELALFIRKYEKEQNKLPVPIIGITAHASDTVAEESKKAGMDKVIAKPLTLAKFQEILQEFALSTEEFKNQPLSSLGPDLPDTEAQLFAINHHPLFDLSIGVSLLGSEDIVKMILKNFKKDTIDADLAIIKKSHEEGEWETIEKLAHKIKGGACYGTIRLYYALLYMERYLKAKHIKCAEALYSQMLRVIEETTDYLEKNL